jgi:hypothetical protein
MDSIVSMEVVTYPDEGKDKATTLIVNATSNGDLFWVRQVGEFPFTLDDV